MAGVLLVGASSYVGRGLLACLEQRGWDVCPTFFRHPQALGCRARSLDVRDREAVLALLQEARPQLVFHLAYDMEDLEGSVVRGTLNLLEGWKAVGNPGPFIFISTDMVFDGESAPYREGDPPKPITDYGRAKRKAELLAMDAGATVVRTSLVYGWNPPDSRTASLLKGLRGKGFDYPYFVDEIRSPIFQEDLCQALAELAGMEMPLPPILHLAGPHSLSRYAMACQVARALKKEPALLPKARLADSGLVRPRDLSLDASMARRLLSFKPRSIQEALKDFAVPFP